MVEVQVPASAANLGPGFDVVGMALDLFNVVEVATAATGVSITVLGEKGELPLDESNLLARAASALFERIGAPLPGLRMRVQQRIPVSRGLGSSAAAIVGGLLAANALAGSPLSENELFELATTLEGHPDNVGAALFGGLVVSVASLGGPSRPYRCVKLNVPEDLDVVLAIPDIRVPTELARQVLPRSVPLEDAVHNIGRAAMLVASFALGKLDALGDAMDDRLHQPYRSRLTPGLEDVVTVARRAGALGAALSGSGPTVIALTTTGAGHVAAAMAEAFAMHGVACRTMVTRASARGATVACPGCRR